MRSGSLSRNPVGPHNATYAYYTHTLLLPRRGNTRRVMRSISDLSIVIWNSLDAASAPNNEMDSLALSE